LQNECNTLYKLAILPERKFILKFTDEQLATIQVNLIFVRRFNRMLKKFLLIAKKKLRKSNKTFFF